MKFNQTHTRVNRFIIIIYLIHRANYLYLCKTNLTRKKIQSNENFIF